MRIKSFLNGLKRLPSSLSFRVLVLAVLGGLVINFLVFGFFRHWVRHNRQLISRNVEVYAEYIVRDLGSPPDRERARQISDRTGIIILWQPRGKTGWSSRPGTPTPERIRREGRPLPRISGRLRVLDWRDQHFMEFPHADGTILLTLPRRGMGPEGRPPWSVAWLILALSLVLLVFVLLLRLWLRPIRHLLDGVSALADGNLGGRLTPRGAGEFRVLISAFNRMSERIHQMLEARRRLLLDVSHELRSPLTRIRLYGEFLDNHPHADDLKREVRQMDHLLSQILDSARGPEDLSPPGSREPVDPLALTREELEARGSDPTTISLEVRDLRRETKSRPRVRVNPGQLRQVLRNLLDNAWKYGGESPFIRMQIRVNPSGKIVWSLRDHGIGIPPEHLPRIFEPFYRTDEARGRDQGGVGLGLNLSRKIIRAHGGDIHLYSRPGTGTLVRFWLPFFPLQ